MPHSSSSPASLTACVANELAVLLRSFCSALGNAGVALTPNDLIAALRRAKSGDEAVREVLTIDALCDQYQKYADGYYFECDGFSSSEAEIVETALRLVRKSHGRSRAVDFGPRKLKVVRDEMIERRWSRPHINRQIGRIKRMFKWATENEMLAPTVFHALNAVAGLRRGRTTAHEPPPVTPVAQPLIDAVIPRVSHQVAAMIRIQLLTGMRPGETIIMRLKDIDRGSQPWLYRPFRHKTEHHGHERIVFLGPQAQSTLAPFVDEDRPGAFLFSPAEADRDRRRRLHEQRVTPMSCGNKPGSNRKSNPKKKPGERYTTHTYGRAIIYACQAAYPLPEGLDGERSRQWRRDHWWHPHQLRHNAATRLRREFGLDAAQVVLGHKTLAVTQVYAERDFESAREVMAKVG